MNGGVVAGLVRKELRQLLPVIASLAGVVVVALVDALLFEVGDRERWADTSVLFAADVGIGMTAVGLIVGMLTAYNLLPGEHDQRTIDFLYSLPVRRRVVFGAKVSTAAAIIVAYAALGTATGFLHLLNRDSVGHGRPPPHLIALELTLITVFHLYALSYGMLLSFFRRLGWVLLAVVALALQLIERVIPPLRVLNPAALFDIEHHGVTPLVPWRSWALHLAFAVLALIVASRLWLWHGEGGLAASLARVRLRPGLRRFAGALAMVAAALFAGALMVFDQAGDADDPAHDDAPAARITTRHFTITHRPEEEARARFVARHAEDAYQRVRNTLRAPEVDRIVADLTDRSVEHAGLAGWKKLRMDVTDKSDAELRLVLFHEMAHVLSAALAEGWSEARDAEARGFLEGLADHVAFDLLGETERRRRSRAIAAAARTRYRVGFRDLLTPGTLTERHDEYLLYALGEAWVAALVATCGADAPGRVLAAWGKDGDTPQALSGQALWRHTLQGLPCDLDRVIGRFEQILGEAPADARALPIASARLVGGGANGLELELSVRADTPGPHHTHLALRDGPSTSTADYVRLSREVTTEKPVRVTIPRPDILVGERFQVMVGVSPAPGAAPFFSPWQSTALPR